MVKFPLILSLQHAIKISTNLSLQHALKISTKKCSCTVVGSDKVLDCDAPLTPLAQLCKKDHELNSPLLEPYGGIQSVSQTHVGCKNDGLFTTDAGQKDNVPVSSSRLCLNSKKVNGRKKRLVEHLGDTFTEQQFTNMNNVHVIARATASQRDAKTGKHQETVEWDTLVVAVNKFFKELNSKFKDMQIMPIENEGKFALKAMQTLLKPYPSEGGILGRMNGYASQQKLISMEQGGRSMQIWSDTKAFGKPIEIPNKEGIQELFLRWGIPINSKKYEEFYGEYTGLYSNLGNGEIKSQLGANSSCLLPITDKTKNEFNRGACREELQNLEMNRSKSDQNGTLPQLIAGGLYAAFGCFYFPAKLIKINDKILEITEALNEVKEALEKGIPQDPLDKASPRKKVCPDKAPAVETDIEATSCMQLLVLEMILKGMIENKKAVDTVMIVFVNEINKKQISWTVGLAETIKEEVEDEEADIVVLDIGSSSTKIFKMSKNKGDNWSDMKPLKTLKEGDLKSMTEPIV